eukprot:scaffold32013_cov64-Skeletonema_dohrnii-CCMP3373.AAC.1
MCNSLRVSNDPSSQLIIVDGRGESFVIVGTIRYRRRCSAQLVNSPAIAAVMCRGFFYVVDIKSRSLRKRYVQMIAAYSCCIRRWTMVE